MKRRMLIVTLMLLTLLLPIGATLPFPAAAAASYTITDLGTLPGHLESVAYDINDSGQVVGYSGTFAGSQRAFLWQGGVMSDLGTLTGFTHSEATAINAVGQVVGSSQLSMDGSPRRAFLWQHGAMTDLGTLPDSTGSYASGINTSGRVVGRLDRTYGGAFLWQNGTMSDLQQTIANNINDANQVVGFSGQAFLWQNGATTYLGTLPGCGLSHGFDINNLSQVVGESYQCSGDDYGEGFGHAFLWQGGVMTDLGTLADGGRTIANAINDVGQIVGWGTRTTGNAHAVVWRDGAIYDLNDLIPPDSDWELAEAFGINASGQIVGRGFHKGSVGTHAFLLTPTSLGTLPPVITTLNPTSRQAGSLQFSLTVNGSGFKRGATVRWNGSPRPTTVVNGTQLTAQISAADIAQAGTASVTVVNPGGGTSNSVTFTITASGTKQRHAVIFVGGVLSQSNCEDSDNNEDEMPEEGPKWIKEHLKSDPLVNAKVNITDTDYAYFSYSGRYCDVPIGQLSGEGGQRPDYAQGDTCLGFDEVQAPRLKGLIERVAARDPSGQMRITLVAYSQGGLLAAYTVGRLHADGNDALHSRIASIVTFDSFPHGLNNTGVTAAKDWGFNQPGRPDRDGCIAASANFADWREDSYVATTARRAVETYGSPPQGYVYFYALGGTKLFFSVAGLLGRNVAEQPGGVFYTEIPDTDHGTIWNDPHTRSREVVSCAILREKACPPAVVRQSLKQGQSITARISSALGSLLLRVRVNWPGSTVAVALISPSGVRYDSTNLPAFITREAGPTFDNLTVASPEPGEWTIELYGVDLAPEGEEVVVFADNNGRSLTLRAIGDGSIVSDPASSIVEPGTVVTLSPQPAPGMIFTGWVIDGESQGWAAPLTVTMSSDHTVQATFVPHPSFGDVPPSVNYHQAVTELAARGIIKGCDPALGLFCPADNTLRAQMAALIVRAMGWTGEAADNPFTDRNGVDDELWQAVAILAAHDVARGYGDGTYGTTDDVLNAQVISFVTRAMVARGYWQYQPDTGAAYPNIPGDSGHRVDVATYVHYAGALPDFPEAGAAFPYWDSPSTREWFARVLWQALDSYFGR